MRSFLAIARLKNMTRAAAELHLTQPALSSQIGRLENELGQRLFQRSRRGMVLTEAGIAFARHAARALAEIDAGFSAVAEVSGVVRGRLQIGGGATATSYLLPPLLHTLLSRHPEVEINVREQGSDDVRRAVHDGAVDIGIVTSGGRSQGRWALHERPWVSDELVLIVPPGHPLGSTPQRSFVWADLRDTPMVLFESGSAIRHMLDEAAAKAGIRLKPAMELRSIASIRRMVEQGIGAGFVSRFALCGEDLEGLSCAQAPLQRQLSIATSPERATRSVTRAFLELLESTAPPSGSPGVDP